MKISPPIAVVRPMTKAPCVWAFNAEEYFLPDFTTVLIRIESTEQIEALIGQLIQTNKLLDQMTETAKDLNGLLCMLRACYGLSEDALAQWRVAREQLTSIEKKRPGLYDWAYVGKEGAPA